LQLESVKPAIVTAPLPKVMLALFDPVAAPETSTPRTSTARMMRWPPGTMDPVAGVPPSVFCKVTCRR